MHLTSMTIDAGAPRRTWCRRELAHVIRRARTSSAARDAWVLGYLVLVLAGAGLTVTSVVAAPQLEGPATLATMTAAVAFQTLRVAFDRREEIAADLFWSLGAAWPRWHAICRSVISRSTAGVVRTEIDRVPGRRADQCREGRAHRGAQTHRGPRDRVEDDPALDGAGPRGGASKRRFEAIAVMAGEGLPVEVACRVLVVSVSGYYAWRGRPPSQRASRHAWLADVIREAHLASRGIYGSRRIHADLVLGRTISISHGQVELVMSRAGSRGVGGRPKWRRTKPDTTASDDTRHSGCSPRYSSTHKHHQPWPENPSSRLHYSRGAPEPPPDPGCFYVVSSG